MKLNGISASPGIAIAKVLKLTHQLLNINNQVVSDVKLELSSFNEAVKKTNQQIEQIKALSLNNLSTSESEVFNAHLQILNDPVFQGDISELISNTKVNALFAVQEISNKYVDLFESMDNQYMRERALDVKDVTNRLLNNLANVETLDLSQINEPVILISNDITPSETAQMNKQFILGFATNVGGKTSHAAIMARSLEIPAVLGLKTITDQVKDGDQIALDGEHGFIIINPTPEQKSELLAKKSQLLAKNNELKRYFNQPTLTKDQIKVELAANVGSINDAELALKHDAQGIGLFRSEFLYMDKKNWPSEEEQFNVYKAVLEKMNNKLVVIRTLDIGGDKHLDYFKFPKEDNPFLGYRAIRLSLDQPAIFKTQLRALIRASIFGRLAIMFPMIATIDEFLQAKAIYNEVYQELKAAHYHISDNIQVGMMIEVPAAAILAEQFAKHADFFSIGTNDLMQYSMAHDRMNQKVAYLYQPLNPAILNLLNIVVQGSHKQNKWVGICGEMGGDPKVIPFLIGMGFDELSMSSSLILQTRAQIAKIDTKAAQTLVKTALKLDTSSDVEILLNDFNNQ